jgi:hypothetical protein
MLFYSNLKGKRLKKKEKLTLYLGCKKFITTEVTERLRLAPRKIRNNCIALPRCSEALGDLCGKNGLVS